ncbi:MAG: flagellar biosynthesis protein FlhA [Deltaproteobacteria bacterium]|nr:flagellar biosynthesis protein FlhA [Deltaproteobacteria bacterium]
MASASAARPAAVPFAGIRANADALLALGVFAVVAIMMVPLPPIVLDLMLAGSITLSLLVFLVAIYTRRPVEFSVFPTVLLVTTVFRLSLNVASTRLILTHGSEGTHAAGHVIEAVGNFLIGGNALVGFIVFCILVTINFMVVTKGAGRVAEVAARFTLDAMPGKQMAVDAELNAGLIDEKTAKRRRAEVAREADFYGAMDGASKFIKGDAIAAIIITLINIVGGIIIGVVMDDLDVVTALSNYTILTIGDGLASQFPALITSAAAGMLVTRVNDVEDNTLDNQIGHQLLGNPRVIAILAVLASFFVFVPGLRLVFAIIAVALGALAYALRNQAPVASAAADDAPAAPAETPIEDLLKVDPVVIELGLDLLYLGDEQKGGQLVQRIQQLRRQVASDLGLVLPTFRLRDNVRLGAGQYRILLRGETIGQGNVVSRQNLALDPGTATAPLKGTEGKDPVFGMKGYWVPDAMRLKAQSLGYTVVDVPTVLTTHLDDLVKRHAHELFGRQNLADALERVSQSNPKLVEELTPDPLPRSAVLRVFRNLIAEGVGVRDTQGILEALSEFAPRTRDPDVLTEFVRARLARAVTARFTGDDGVLRYIGLAADAEDAVSRGLQGNDGGAMSLVLDPDTTRKLFAALRHQVESYSGPGEVVLLVPPLARGPMRRLIEKALPRVPVMSPSEIVPGTGLERAGELSLRPLKSAAS